ncbi:pyridoxal-phosphate dependent enzyme [Candidatus Bathyarchaeota archaeon]|nr:pyridoxal-phosphate dependent enzyme [Candidatus Bathyarchaeota archaeon]
MDILQNELIQNGIGDTILTHSRNLEKLLVYNNIFLKFEGGNPTGTMKDRAAYACLKEAKELGYKEIAIGSCGNFGAAFVYVAKLFDIIPHVYIPQHYHTQRILEMEKNGGIIHRAPGSYEDVVFFSSKEAKKNNWFDANPGVKLNTKLSIDAYATISYEILNNLGKTPDYVAIPVGNGTTIAGIHHGFKILKINKIIKKLPILIAASTSGGNPIIKCFQENKKQIEDLKPNEIIETDYNEPLVSWISLDGQEALNALWESKGWSTYVEDNELVHYSNLLEKEEGLSVLPASAGSLAAIAKYIDKNNPKKGLTFVAVLTGRKF